MTIQTWIDPRVDRSKWPTGEWDGEPDKVQWTDEATGMTCLAKRHQRSGHWCGYVGVGQDHPLHGKGYYDPDVDVHGGLTYAAMCMEGPPAETVCHIPAPGTPAHLYWFGFDCHHAWDYSPLDKVYEAERGYPFTVGSDAHYRTLEFVKRQCASLAAQLAGLSASEGDEQLNTPKCVDTSN